MLIEAAGVLQDALLRPVRLFGHRTTTSQTSKGVRGYVSNFELIFLTVRDLRILEAAERACAVLLAGSFLAFLEFSRPEILDGPSRIRRNFSGELVRVSFEWRASYRRNKFPAAVLFLFARPSPRKRVLYNNSRDPKKIKFQSYFVCCTVRLCIACSGAIFFLFNKKNTNRRINALR